MKTFIAVNKTGADRFGHDVLLGNWITCLHWARSRSVETGYVYVIAKARPGENYKPLVAEVTRECVRRLPENRGLSGKLSRLVDG